jgi:hypothetical protein
MQPEDRAYLVRLTAATTGLAQPDAERRVDEVAARAKEHIARARKSAVILASNPDGCCPAVGFVAKRDSEGFRSTTTWYLLSLTAPWLLTQA